MGLELSFWVGIFRPTPCLFKFAVSLLAAVALSVNAAQIDIPGPAGSSTFGTTVTVLPNGNIVVTDPTRPPANAGAAYLYSPTGVLINTLTGNANNQVGSGGVTVLSNGNYVVSSDFWDNGTAMDVGAVTWVNGNTGLSGVVSAANSLVGTTAFDRVGSGGVTVLGNGNYAVRSPAWDNGAVVTAGAVTWARGSTGLSGVVSTANSLVGTTTSDSVGSNGVIALSNGNYVVVSSGWDKDTLANVGAVTWASGSTGLSGAVSSANSLIAGTLDDFVGSGGVIALSNGNYVVRSQSWTNGAIADVGAVTWANGTTGLTGVVSPTNSLIGTKSGDLVQGGGVGVTELSNGHYVVASSSWDNGSTLNVGAVTWANGSAGLTGAVSPVNSLVGTTADDSVGGGSAGVIALSNGHYVVRSSDWDNGATLNVGAVTWANGTTGLSGAVSQANSLIGTTSSDFVGNNFVTALSNGNYVVASPSWNNGTTVDVGAVTWAKGSTGLSGIVAPANSLIGTTQDDRVGSVVALSNGNYVVRSLSWSFGNVDVGAVTWANGNTGFSGTVSPGNSLIGSTTSDQVGLSVTAVGNGNYVVASSNWRNGFIASVGAVTWANGSTGLSGEVAPTNSLIGTVLDDRVGNPGVTALSDGSYVIRSSLWNNGAITDAGAVTLARDGLALTGTIFPNNGVQGTVAGAGANLPFGYDIAREQLVVGRPASNIVSLFTLPPELVFANGFE